jgi:hypothetical protein
MMNRLFTNRILIAAIVLAAAALACSAPNEAGQPPMPTTIPTGVGGPSDSSATSTPLPADTTSICPEATAGTVLVVSEENGYCFLYPDWMKDVSTDYEKNNRAVALVGPPLDPTAMESAAAYMSVTYTGQADVADATAYATRWHELNGAEASAPAPATINGNPAMVIENIPGMMYQRVALLVIDGQKFVIQGTQPGAPVELDQQTTEAWDTVTGSIVFFTPSNVLAYVSPDNVCPNPTENTKQHIDLKGGVCMLYPASFSLMTMFGQGIGAFETEPVLGEFANMPIKANLVISAAGPSQGKTPRQLFEPRLVNQEVSQIDVAGATETTLGGYPAIVWTEGEPVGSRQGIIVANGTMYTIIDQPYNDPRRPGGQENVELVWNVVTQSLAFFTAWR